MNHPFDVDYFIEKFSNIPAERWATGKFEDYSNPDKPRYDAQGFCGMNQSNRSIVASASNIHEVPYYLHEAWCLLQIFGEEPKVGAVNNGTAPGYKQSTARERVLTRLCDIRDKKHKEPDKNLTDRVNSILQKRVSTTTFNYEE